MTLAFMAMLPSLAPCQDGGLTIEQAIALARERSPAALQARERIAEARGRLLGASVLVRENPELSAATGPRRSAGGDTTDWDVELSQRFEIGGRRRARISGAQAGVERETAVSDDSIRLLLRDVASAFVRALAAGEGERLAQAAAENAGDLMEAAMRRHEAGDIPVLDLNLARIAVARARSSVTQAQAARESTLAELRALLGLAADRPLELRGDLRGHRQFELTALLSGLSRRPDLRSLGAEIREAEAEQRLGEGMAWPELSFKAGYEREEEDEILLGGLSVALPVFERGQGVRAVASARARRLRLEYEAALRAAEVEVRAAHEAYRLRVAAVEDLETEALPGLDDNELLIRLAYEGGEVSLAELLTIRREIRETRLFYLERLLEAALAEIDLQVLAGVLQ